MSDDLRWKLGARTPAHDYRIFKTAFVDATNPRTGAAKRFSVLEGVDWVNVIAMTRDDRIVLVRQYRAGLDKVCLEIPGGMVDAGEDMQTAAARELVEETGYTAPTWRLLGRVSPNPAIQTNTLHMYLALDAELTAPQHLDEGEVLTVETLPLAEVQRQLRSGEIEHALVLAAFALLALELGPLRRPG